jgi:C-terminal processing protease CtpA/Prc
MRTPRRLVEGRLKWRRFLERPLQLVPCNSHSFHSLRSISPVSRRAWATRWTEFLATTFSSATWSKSITSRVECRFTRPGVSTHTAGILGAEILKRFHVVVDYRRQRVRIRPNREFATPIEFDMSGTSLAATSLKSPSYRVRSIIEGSPAAEAGITPNDVITHVNGAASADTTLNEVRRMLRVPDATYTLTVTRDGASRTVTLRTRRMI